MSITQLVIVEMARPEDQGSEEAWEELSAVVKELKEALLGKYTVIRVGLAVDDAAQEILDVMYKNTEETSERPHPDAHPSDFAAKPAPKSPLDGQWGSCEYGPPTPLQGE